MIILFVKLVFKKHFQLRTVMLIRRFRPLLPK